MKKVMMLTEEVKRNLKPLYTYENTPPDQVPVALKVFNPYGKGTWYITEYDGENIAFGLCCLFEPELGYVSLNELNETRVNVGPFKFPLERDRHWKGTLADAYKAENYPHVSTSADVTV